MTEPLDAGPALIRASTAVGGIYDDVSASLGLTSQQARLLFVVSRRPSNMLGLGSVLGLGKSTMTGVIARMEAAGLVVRAADADDRRHLLVTATGLGAHLAALFEEAMRTRLEELLDGFDAADRATLGALLSRIIERAEDAGRADDSAD